MEKKKRIAEILGGLGAAFDKELGPEIIRIYWHALQNYEIEELEVAANRAVMELKFFPKVAELVEFIEGSQEGRVAEAWNVFLKALEMVGIYQSVQFEDLAIQDVIKTWGGWIAVQMMTNDQLRFKVREFGQLYRHAYTRRARNKMLQAGIVIDEHLAGLSESENRAKGALQEIAPPIRVGPMIDGRLTIDGTVNAITHFLEKGVKNEQAS